MTDDRRMRVEAARDRYHAEAQASPVLCLHGEQEGIALDLSRLANAAFGAGSRGPRVLGSIVEALGAPVASPLVLAVAGDGTPLANALGALAHSVRSDRIETGADDLAIGFPWLEGRIADGTLVRAPLFLYPATLTETLEGPWAWTLEIGGAPWLNEALATLFRRLTRVRLSYEDFLAHDEDGLFKCDDATWQGLVKTLQRAGVTLADTATALAAPLAFETLNEAKTAKIPPGQFRLQNHLVLGRFPMAAAATASDIEALLQTSLDGYSLAGASALFDVPADEPGFVGRAPGRPRDDAGAFGALRRWQVLPTDPHQEDALRCIEDLVAENDCGLVVVGPPGTGRSQLIANTVAGAVQKGLKVLVTSPRRAALDDVAWRLAGLGLGEPLALVHDPWRDRSPLCNGIAESVDPIVTDLIAPPELGPDLAALGALEEALRERIGAADQAFDTLTGSDGGHPGLAELDEAAFIDDVAVPDLTDCVAQLTRADLARALPEVQRLAPHAAPFIVPHPLSARSDWGELTSRDIVSFYRHIDAARRAIEHWARLPAVLAPADLDRHRRLLQEHARPIVELAQGDDPEALKCHAEVVSWLEDPTPQAVHTRFLEELRSASHTLQPVPAELARLEPNELAERIANLDKLAKMEASGLRHFSPAFWSLKNLPAKITASLPPETSKDPAELCALHREAAKWHKLLDSLPDEPAFRLEQIGAPEVLRELVRRLDDAFEICAAEERVVRELGPLGMPARPDWASMLREEDFRRAASPFLVALVDELARAHALDAAYAAVGELREPLSQTLFEEVRAFARDRPAAAEGRLAALAATVGQGPEVLALDQATAQLPGFVGRFLRGYIGPTADARMAARRAVQEAWRTLRLGGLGPTAIEAPLVDPRELRALADALTELEAARTRVVVGRWKARVHGLMELESQRQDLVKLVNEAGRKRLRATLRQIVERYWKRGLGVLRPAWFAPLESIASIFPRDRDTFDLVIIDEAQRASLGAALPALMRARRVLLLGDPCQAPPTVPEQAAGDPVARDSYRSILPLGGGAWPQTALWWCWGARREELWEFPNAAAYAGAVVVAPNAEKRARGRSEGLKWTKVDGSWQDGTNKAEADKTVEIVAEALADRLGEDAPSVGVVAFTAAQAALIRRQIDRRAARDEGFRALLRKDRERPECEQLAVGDLVGSPVDARDVLVLSLTYATTDKSKRLQTDYGQLAAPDGENFLTGVVTRARVGLHIVCSFHDVALDAGRQAHLGPKMLDALLGFTQGVALGDERIEAAALARLAAATGIQTAPIEPCEGVGHVVRGLLSEPLVERGLGVSLEPMSGPVAPDMTVAPTQKSAARVAIQTTRFLQEPNTFARDVWSRRFWQRQGWVLVRVTPGVWRASPSAVVRALEKLFSLPARADQKIVAAAERRLALERVQAETAAARLEEGMRWAAEAEAEAARRWAGEKAALAAPERAIEQLPAEIEELPVEIEAAADVEAATAIEEVEAASAEIEEAAAEVEAASAEIEEAAAEVEAASAEIEEAAAEVEVASPEIEEAAAEVEAASPEIADAGEIEAASAEIAEAAEIEAASAEIGGAAAEVEPASVQLEEVAAAIQEPPATIEAAPVPPKPLTRPTLSRPVVAPLTRPKIASAPAPQPAPSAPAAPAAPPSPTRPPVPRPPTGTTPRPPARIATPPTPAPAPAPGTPAAAVSAVPMPPRPSIPLPPARPSTVVSGPPTSPPRPAIPLPPKSGSVPRPPASPPMPPSAPTPTAPTAAGDASDS